MKVAEESGLNIVTGEFVQQDKTNQIDESKDKAEKMEQSKTKIQQHQQWNDIIKKIFKTLNKMEKNKTTEPKFSMVIFPLIKYIKKRYNF